MWIRIDLLIRCPGGALEDFGRPCQQDQRVTFKSTDSTCAIDVENTNPNDTGQWHLRAVFIPKPNTASFDLGLSRPEVSINYYKTFIKHKYEFCPVWCLLLH